MRNTRLDKIVLSIKPNAETFLNGLTSNALDAPQNAFLNLHGRIIATFDQIRLSEDAFLIVISPHAQGALMEHVARYLKLSHAQMTPTDFQVYFDLDGDMPIGEGEYAIPQKKGKLIITQNPKVVNVSPDELTKFRLEHHIPWHGVDYQDEMVLNVHEYDFVSYTKGCFLGQEPVAKVHNRSKPTWELAVRYQDELSSEEQAKMTSTLFDPQTKRTQGFVFVKQPFPWDKDTQSKFEQVIAKIPEFLRAIAKKKVSQRAESLAQARNASEVSEKDLVDALFLETPFGFHGPMKNDMQQIGIPYEQYGHPR